MTDNYVLSQPPPSYGGGDMALSQSQPSYGGGGMRTDTVLNALTNIRFNLPEINLFSYVKLILLFLVLTASILAIVMVLQIVLHIRLSKLNAMSAILASLNNTHNKSPSTSTSALASSQNIFNTHLAASSLSSLYTDDTNMIVSCTGDTLCEKHHTLVARAYVCVRPMDYSVNQQNNVLQSADVWILLGDELASGTGSSSFSVTSWINRLLNRVKTVSTLSVSLFNSAGMGYTGFSNITLQIAALKQNREYISLMNNDASYKYGTADSTVQHRAVVLVSIGRNADVLTLNNAEQLLESIWDPLEGLIPNSADASRYRVVFLIPPDPYWGTYRPTQSLAVDILSSCCSNQETNCAAAAGQQPPSWLAVKQRRNLLRNIFYNKMTQKGAIVVDIDAALGKFSLGVQESELTAAITSAFHATCSSDRTITQSDFDIVSPLFNDKGHSALAELLWQCLTTEDAIYSIPESLSA